eukprot:3076229-Amphidinium_carterae.1
MSKPQVDDSVKSFGLDDTDSLNKVDLSRLGTGGCRRLSRILEASISSLVAAAVERQTRRTRRLGEASVH